jgi:hypothetical protein
LISRASPLRLAVIRHPPVTKQQDASYRRSPAFAARRWHCAILSLASGITGLATSIYLWWKPETRLVRTLGQQVGLFSAVIGIGLALIAAYGSAKLARRLSVIALIVNIAVLCFTLDNMLHIINW